MAATRSAPSSTSTTRPCTAERRGLAYGGYVDLAGKADVLQLVKERIESVNADLAAEEGMADTQIARFLVLHKESISTTTSSPAHARCAGASSPTSTRCWSMRSTAAEQYIETQVKFEDGRTGKG